MVLYSASGEDMHMVKRQLFRFATGLVAMIAVAQIPAESYQRWSTSIYILGTILLILVILLGIQAKGAQRWLQIPGLFRFQPSELMKLAVPLFMARYFAKRMLPPSWAASITGLLITAIPVALIAIQPDLGTAILIGTSGMIVLFLAGISWKWVSAGILMCFPAAGILWMFMHDYQKTRVLTLLDPQSDPLGAGWNIIQSKTAIGSGGLKGKGWLNGTQSHLDFLPESSTDFIIAVLCEEFGFLGFLSLLSLYAFILIRGLYISLCAQTTFNRLLSGAIILTFFIYLLVNIGMVSGLLPVVGVPLPLVSYGGTSIVTLMVGFGILMSIHTHRKLLAS